MEIIVDEFDSDERIQDYLRCTNDVEKCTLSLRVPSKFFQNVSINVYICIFFSSVFFSCVSEMEKWRVKKCEVYEKLNSFRGIIHLVFIYRGNQKVNRKLTSTNLSRS